MLQEIVKDVIPIAIGIAAGLGMLQFGYWMGTRKKRYIEYAEKA